MAKAYGIFPGMIIGLNSDSTPDNFYACNGANGTLDTRNKLIVGAGSTFALGATGGVANHDHTYPAGSGSAQLVTAPVIKIGGSSYAPAGPATSNAGNYPANTSNLPPYWALPLMQATLIGGVPQNAIVWWNGTVASIPNGWSVFTSLYNRFLMSVGASYARGVSGGATTHNHQDNSASGTWGPLYANGPLTATGGIYSKTGTWGGGMTASTVSLLPLYYGLIPIVSGGVRGIYTGMVLGYNGLIDDLPAEYAEFTTARDKFIIGAGSTYASGNTGGSNTVHSHTGTGGGSGSVGAGSNWTGGAGTAVYLGTMVANVTAPPSGTGNHLAPYIALFYVIAN